MNKKRNASLWLANVESSQRLYDYLYMYYNEEDEDDSTIYGEFLEDFGIDEYNGGGDPDFDIFDFEESNFLEKESNKFSELLSGFSWSDCIIPKFEEKYGDTVKKYYNAVILLYFYDYDVKNISNIKSKIDCQFIGSVEFEC